MCQGFDMNFVADASARNADMSDEFMKELGCALKQARHLVSLLAPTLAAME